MKLFNRFTYSSFFICLCGLALCASALLPYANAQVTFTDTETPQLRESARLSDVHSFAVQRFHAILNPQNQQQEPDWTASLQQALNADPYLPKAEPAEAYLSWVCSTPHCREAQLQVRLGANTNSPLLWQTTLKRHKQGSSEWKDGLLGHLLSEEMAQQAIQELSQAYRK